MRADHHYAARCLELAQQLPEAKRAVVVDGPNLRENSIHEQNQARGGDDKPPVET
jgi:hypothetical protein